MMSQSPSESQSGSAAIALVSNTGEPTKEARRLFEHDGSAAVAVCDAADIPYFEHSHESFLTASSTSPLSKEYDICVAIPRSKKFLLQFTHNEIHLFEYRTPTPPPRRDNSALIHRESRKYTSTSNTFQANTLVYGSICRLSGTKNIRFVMEDVLLWGGNATHALPYGIQLGIMRDIIDHTMLVGDTGEGSMTLVLPVLYSMDRVDAPPLTTIPYTVHHIQYRSLSTCQPHLKCFVEAVQRPQPAHISRPMSMSAPPIQCQGPKNPTIFSGKSEAYTSLSRRQASLGSNIAIYLVRPSTVFDIYYLISMKSLREPNHTHITEIAHIPDYKTSMWMNSLFRSIKENDSLDAIEESDNEDEFEDTTPNKHVFLHREYYMECMYHQKFRKWVPLRVVDPPQLQNPVGANRHNQMGANRHNQARSESSRQTHMGRPRQTYQ